MPNQEPTIPSNVVGQMSDFVKSENARRRSATNDLVASQARGSAAETTVRGPSEGEGQNSAEEGTRLQPDGPPFLSAMSIPNGLVMLSTGEQFQLGEVARKQITVICLQEFNRHCAEKTLEMATKHGIEVKELPAPEPEKPIEPKKGRK